MVWHHCPLTTEERAHVISSLAPVELLLEHLDSRARSLSCVLQACNLGVQSQSHIVNTESSYDLNTKCERASIKY